MILQHAGNRLLNSVLKILLRQRDGLCRYAAFCRRRVAAWQGGVVEQIAQFGIGSLVKLISSSQEIHQQLCCCKIQFHHLKSSAILNLMFDQIQVDHLSCP